MPLLRQGVHLADNLVRLVLVERFSVQQVKEAASSTILVNH